MLVGTNDVDKALNKGVDINIDEWGKQYEKLLNEVAASRKRK